MQAYALVFWESNQEKKNSAGDKFDDLAGQKTQGYVSSNGYVMAFMLRESLQNNSVLSEDF